ncbi:MAG: right-handed parallel beta-helix repeat-containing protein [Spirochaetes bacterium]|nr:right-handed parallel beta-helix repeat-containing protein [Spirochaetota bacterium]
MKRSNISRIILFHVTVLVLCFGGMVHAGDAGAMTGEMIQQAIDRLPADGGQVDLGEGVWTIRKPLRLKSGSRLCGRGEKTVLLLAGGVQIPCIANSDITNGNTDVVLCSLLLDGNSAGQTFTSNDWGKRWSAAGLDAVDNVGVYIKGCSNVLLSNIVVRNFLNEAVMAVRCGGIQVMQCTFSNICQSNSPRNDFAQGAFYTRYAADCLFVSNVFLDCHEGGIALGFGSDRNRLIGNRSERSPSGEGFFVGCGSGNLFLGNTVRYSSHAGGGTGAGISASVPPSIDKDKYPAVRNMMISNIIEHTGGNGITVMRADNATVSGNIIRYGNENGNRNQGGIKIYMSANAVIDGNILESCAGAGIVIQSSSGAAVSSNRISGCPEGVKKDNAPDTSEHGNDVR